MIFKNSKHLFIRKIENRQHEGQIFKAMLQSYI